MHRNAERETPKTVHRRVHRRIAAELKMASATELLLISLATLFCCREVAAAPVEKGTFPPKPPFWEKAKTARFVTHISDWGSLATIASHDPIKGYPFAKVFSISDGIPGKSSTGTPYLYMTHMDVAAQDVAADPRVTLSLSEAQSDICREEEEDPQSPICAKVMITGQIVEITDEKEVALARSLLFSRHPAMASWPAGHGWFFARLEPKQVQLLDFYGGITTLTPEDYNKADLY